MKSYFTEDFARDTAKLLQVLLEREDKTLIIEHAPLGLKKISLLARLYNSLDYLCDHMDPDGVYKELRRRLRLSKVFNGVKISLMPPIDSLVEAARPIEVIDAKKIVEDAITFAEEAKWGSIFERNDVRLSEDQLTILRGLFESNPDFISIIEEGRIKVVKHQLSSGTETAQGDTNDSTANQT